MKLPKKVIPNILWIIAIIFMAVRAVSSTNMIPKINPYEPPVKIQKIDKKLSEFVQAFNNKEFSKVTVINDNMLIGDLKEEKKTTQNILGGTVTVIEKTQFVSQKPLRSSIAEIGLSLTGDTVIDSKIQTPIVSGSELGSLILNIIFFAVILYFLSGMMRKGGVSSMINIGKQKTPQDTKTNFGDVAGMEEAKNELIEIVDFLKNPEKYKKLGAKIPKGVLLYGPPGSGKTLLARAVAGEASAAFFAASGSEFMEMFVGLGAAKVRELFGKAKAAGNSIIFIDEIDTIGRKRGMSVSGGHQEQEQTLNQILTEMDGFDKNTNVIVIAATNRLDILDPALMRPGRFDRKVYIGYPTVEERLEILKTHFKDKTIDTTVSLDSLARRTSGFVGADLANIANEAALKAAKEGREKIIAKDIEYALEKIVMGPEKKIKSLKDKEREIIAYHELGHAITAAKLPNGDPVEKISIVSRGMALGVTWTSREEDIHLYSKAKLLDDIVMLLGGRASEEIFFGKEEITTGASNDLERVTHISHEMVTRYGMDEDLGNYVYQDINQMMPYKKISDDTAKLIDQKIHKIIENCYQRALAIVQENKEVMDKMAKILLVREYITKEEFNEYLVNPHRLDEDIRTLGSETILG